MRHLYRLSRFSSGALEYRAVLSGFDEELTACVHVVEVDLLRFGGLVEDDASTAVFAWCRKTYRRDVVNHSSRRGIWPLSKVYLMRSSPYKARVANLPGQTITVGQILKALDEVGDKQAKSLVEEKHGLKVGSYYGESVRKM
ncbi:hypothetical protein BU23DRAFT_569768 [Bimuria novae-zelandiae CBS 107.79]|uniref:Uncharacterized protein n=1 Tax=Bimuria novae-zelandiae CBS 107.79 TaxID=1447943 RepID=A0A6A5V3K9_9PLEO|nr:hypothetical protein BU23DRAFT_569768 [Bimuria novae-zelandiae CBS 107.79]